MLVRWARSGAGAGRGPDPGTGRDRVAVTGGAAVFALLYGVPVWGFAMLWLVLAAAITVRTALRTTGDQPGQAQAGGQALRRVAPRRSAASPTAASRATATSAAVSVRSGARNRSVYASDLRPSPTCAPV
jgi:hypothetical protein